MCLPINLLQTMTFWWALWPVKVCGSSRQEDLWRVINQCCSETIASKALTVSEPWIAIIFLLESKVVSSLKLQILCLRCWCSLLNMPYNPGFEAPESLSVPYGHSMSIHELLSHQFRVIRPCSRTSHDGPPGAPCETHVPRSVAVPEDRLWGGFGARGTRSEHP